MNLENLKVLKGQEKAKVLATIKATAEGRSNYAPVSIYDANFPVDKVVEGESANGKFRYIEVEGARAYFDRSITDEPEAVKVVVMSAKRDMPDYSIKSGDQKFTCYPVD